MGASDDFTGADLVIIGAPMDFTVTFRPGARLGPQHVRLLSEGLEEYSPCLDRNLKDYRYFDAGDIILPPGNVQQSLERISSAVEYVVGQEKPVLLLGGEHLISLPAIQAVSRFYPELAIIHLDAHLDLRDEYLEQPLCHATVMRRVAEIVGGLNIYQLGIRSGTGEEFAYARKHTNLYVNELLFPLEKITSFLKNRPVYLTVDIDVLDPAYAPGTGTPEPGGCQSSEIIKAIHCFRDLRVVGMDIVEVNPVYDLSGSTSILAAKLVREAILCCFAHH